jgi:hypothetical protein
VTLDPATEAWADQFGAAVRDKCRALLVASNASGLDNLATTLEDEANYDYRIALTNGTFWLTSLDMPDREPILLDVLRLGV